MTQTHFLIDRRRIWRDFTARIRSWFKAALPFLWRPLTLFHISRVPVRIHPTCFVYPLGFFMSMACYAGGGRGLLLAVMLFVLAGGSLLIHEFAHVYAARRAGIGTKQVVFIPFGAVAEMESPLGLNHEFWVALAGPVASFMIAGALALAHTAAGVPFHSYPDVLKLTLAVALFLNLALGLFNLLPCFPMDGGRMLRAGLSLLLMRLFGRSPDQSLLMATQLAVRFVAWPVAIGMMLLAIFFTHAWVHLVLFPCLLAAAEAEYWLLRTGENPGETDATGPEPAKPTGTSFMKPKRNRLQRAVLQRLEAGLPPTRWQQLRLHLHTAWRNRRKQTPRRIWFHVSGMLRVFTRHRRGPEQEK